MACKIEAQSKHVHVAHKFFARLGTDLHAQSMLSNRISASELGRKFIKSALLVGSPPPRIREADGERGERVLLAKAARGLLEYY